VKRKGSCVHNGLFVLLMTAIAIKGALPHPSAGKRRRGWGREPEHASAAKCGRLSAANLGGCDTDNGLARSPFNAEYMTFAFISSFKIIEVGN
jgi:hypothetical protein